MQNNRKITFNFTNEQLAEIDKFAIPLSQAAKPYTLAEWLYSTPEGRSALLSVASGTLPGFHPSHDIDATIRKLYAEATGGARRGRPQLNDFRYEVLSAALEAYVKTHTPIVPPPRYKDSLAATMMRQLKD